VGCGYGEGVCPCAPEAWWSLELAGGGRRALYRQVASVVGQQCGDPGVDRRGATKEKQGQGEARDKADAVEVQGLCKNEWMAAAATATDSTCAGGPGKVSTRG
jgi:hypothetical protein